MLTANPTLLPGINVVIGGDTYIAPQLNLRGIKALQSTLASGTVTDAIIAAFTLSLIRNYPEANQNWLEETMEGKEYGEAAKLFPGLLETSGLTKPKAASEEAPAGEAPAAVSETSTLV